MAPRRRRHVPHALPQRSHGLSHEPCCQMPAAPREGAPGLSTTWPPEHSDRGLAASRPTSHPPHQGRTPAPPAPFPKEAMLRPVPREPALASRTMPPPGSRDWPQQCQCRSQPPWPNGQGVGLLIRRLRVRVPQGVLSFGSQRPLSTPHLFARYLPSPQLARTDTHTDTSRHVRPALAGGMQRVTLAGLEPAIFGSEDQRLIH